MKSFDDGIGQPKQNLAVKTPKPLKFRIMIVATCIFAFTAALIYVFELPEKTDA